MGDRSTKGAHNSEYKGVIFNLIKWTNCLWIVLHSLCYVKYHVLLVDAI